METLPLVWKASCLVILKEHSYANFYHCMPWTLKQFLETVTIVTITLLIFPGGFFHLVRYTWMSEFLTSLELDMLGLARYNIYIPFIVTSRRFSNFLIVIHPSFLQTGVLWSNFLVYVKMRAAKFCISCSLLRLIFDVPAHTVEQ